MTDDHDNHLPPPEDSQSEQQSNGRSLARKWIADIFKAIGATVAFIVLIPVVTILLLIFFMRPEHGPNFLAKITVDIEVDGEPILIQRIIECRTFEVPPGELFQRLWKRAPTRYFPIVRGMGARLRSGGAIMMYTPYLCDHEVEGTWPFRTIKVTPNPPGAVTMMAWTKDADDPEELEIYASQAYFNHPEARVKINRIEATDPPPGATADPPGEFSWFAPKKVYYKRPKLLGVAETLSKRAKRSPKGKYSSARGYRSLSVAPIGQEIWGQDEPVAAILQTIAQPAVLEGDQKSAADGVVRQNYFQPGNSLGTDGRVAWLYAENTKEVPPNKKGNPRRNLYGHSYPLVVRGSQVQLRKYDGAPYILAHAHPLEHSRNGNEVKLMSNSQPLGEIETYGPFPDYAFDTKNLLDIWSYKFSFEER